MVDAVTPTLEQQQLSITAENDRRQFEDNMEVRRIRLETIRLAKDALIENSRSKSIDERDVSAEDIKTYANSLYSYINSSN